MLSSATLAVSREQVLFYRQIGRGILTPQARELRQYTCVHHTGLKHGARRRA